MKHKPNGAGRRRQRTLRQIAAILLVTIPVSGAAVYRFSGELFADRTEPTANPEAEIAVAEEGTVRVNIERPAMSEPIQVQTLRAPTTGTIESIEAVGQYVPAGRRLVAIDRDALERQVHRAELAVEEAELDHNRALAAVRKAAAALEEREALFDVGAVSRDQVESARDQLETAEHSVRAAQLKLDRAELDLETASREREEAIMRAPFDGTVLSVDTAVGERVGQNSTLLTFGDLSSLRFTAELDEYDVRSVERGMQVVIRSDALGEAISRARVESISPGAEIVNNIPVFRITAISTNADGVLRPGMSADLQVMVARDSGVVVPSRAVSTGRDGQYVEVVLGDESSGSEDSPDTVDHPNQSPGDEAHDPAGDELQDNHTHDADDHEPQDVAVSADDPAGDEPPADGDEAREPAINTERRPVETGANDGLRVVILSGLEAGERVLLPEVAGTLPAVGSQPPEPSPSTSIIPMPGSGSGGGGGGGGGGR